LITTPKAWILLILLDSHNMREDRNTNLPRIFKYFKSQIKWLDLQNQKNSAIYTCISKEMFSPFYFSIFTHKVHTERYVFWAVNNSSFSNSERWEGTRVMKPQRVFCPSRSKPVV
jgi:hypothetical protein